MPIDLQLVPRHDERRAEPAAGRDAGAAAPEFPPGWGEYAAARRRFLARVAWRPPESELLGDGEDESRR